MNFKPILIVAGEPNSVFLEIFFKTIKSKKFKSPIIIITSEKILKQKMKKFNFKKKIKLINLKYLYNEKLNNKFINLININFNQKDAFKKITKKSNKFIETSFITAFKILKDGQIKKFINAISKKIS